MRQVKLFQIAILIVVTSHSASLWSQSSDIDATFRKGNENYENRDYAAAIAEYEQITANGFESWEVYYNLGNAYYRQGDIAKAILNFERGKRLNPKNEDLTFNLELANLSVVDRIPGLPKFFLIKWIESAANLLNLEMLAIITFIGYFVIMSLMTSRLFLKRESLRKGSLVAIVTSGLGLLVFSAMFAFKVYQHESKVEAVIMSERVNVLSAPGDSGTEVFALHAGMKVEVQDRSGEWLKIRLSDGKLGWLRSETLQHI